MFQAEPSSELTSPLNSNLDKISPGNPFFTLFSLGTPCDRKIKLATSFIAGLSATFRVKYFSLASLEISRDFSGMEIQAKTTRNKFIHFSSLFEVIAVPSSSKAARQYLVTRQYPVLRKLFVGFCKE